MCYSVATESIHIVNVATPQLMCTSSKMYCNHVHVEATASIEIPSGNHKNWDWSAWTVSNAGGAC